MDGDEARSGPTEQDFHCSCCYELMVDPTTLNCGHSFCRLCLARWWKSSKNTTCPECRQPWQGFPSVNIILRKTIRSLFPVEIGQRQVSILQNNSDYHSVMFTFEAYGKKITNRRSGISSTNQGNKWLKIVGFLFSAMGILMFLYELLSLWMSGHNSVLTNHHIITWTPDNVSGWVGSLGSWAKGDYDARFLDAGIDGRVLMTLTESDLQETPLSIDVSYHRKVILKGLEELKMSAHRIRPPADFWEYKAVYPANSIFYLVGLREFPRATMIYMFFFNYEDLFYPLLKYTSEPDMGDMSTGDGPLESYVSSVDYTRFLVRVTLVPYYVIGRFAFKWLHLNHWVGSVVIIYCALMTLAEFTKLKWLFFGGWRELPGIIMKNASQAVLNGMFHMVLWQVMPSLICDAVFYWMLFLSPFAAWKSFKAGAMNADADHHTMRVLFSWVWRNARGPIINFHARHN